MIPNENLELASGAARELGVPLLIGRLLARRGFTDFNQAHHFLNPQLDHLHDPFLMRDMAAAVARLKRAIDRKEKILIYGDYDVDGTMAVVVLLTALRGLGASVESYIPDRLTDGYGMQTRVVERAAEAGARVIVSVDTGIREHEVLRRMKELGIDGIVTDHHLQEDSLPEACAILNPHRADCAYPEKNLAGVGVAFKLAQALLGSGVSQAVARSYLKLVAIGSIADVVPLTGENRVIAHFGLAGLTESALAATAATSGRAGISALLAVAGLQGKKVTAGDVAFRIAPRLNAAGRMESARRVIDLFASSSDGGAHEIAMGLDELNRARQRMEDEIICEVQAQMKAQPEKADRYTLLFAGEGWHRGVIGIIAQRVVDLFHRPALVLSAQDGVAHGSGRSIRGFHLLNALTQSRGLLSRFGGHAQAAGFSLPVSRIKQLEEEFERYARSVLVPADLEPQLRIDAAIGLGELSEDLCAGLKRLEPFGCGNPTPVFTAEADLAGPPRILKENHLKLCVKGPGKSFEAIGWRMAGHAAALAGKKRVALAFSVSENTFQGRTDVQLALKDIRPA
ncbi:MAG: single-stranded-DNA-specific exonuclease RecJ [Terriglobia bacterium]